jgi:outer membrane usher protein FimD/PapC
VPGPMKRHRVAGALSLCLVAAPGPSVAADAVVAASNPAQGESIILRVKLNTEDRGDLFVERTPDRDFLVKVQDLKAMGFREPPGKVVMVDGEPHISLRSIPGVTFRFNDKQLTLDITAPPQLFATQSFTVEDQRRRAVIVPNNNSLFVNYALSGVQGESTPSGIDFAGELGWRRDGWLLLTDGSTVRDLQGRQKFVRLMSSWQKDDRTDLRRTVIGDFYTPTREFSNGVNVGGISISKLYGLNPYYIQYPMQSVSGNVALPSQLEVYVDGQRVRTEQLRPGEFQLNDILAYGGAHNVQLLVRDAFGRVQTLNYSFYFSDQPLREGLHEYSYNVGAIRRDYGLRSNAYGPAAFSMFHRYGFSSAVTLGFRAEGTRQLLNAGPLATLVLGSAGVAGLAAAASSIDGQRGASALASYNFQVRDWAFGASLRRDWRSFATLGDPPLVTNRKYEGNVTASYHFPQSGTVSLSHSFLSTRDGFVASAATPSQPFSVSVLERRRVSSVTYSTPVFSGKAVVTSSLSHINDVTRGSRNEAFVGVNIFLDRDYTVATSVRADRSVDSESFQFIKRQPIGEGLGYTITADRSADPTGHSLRLDSSVQYNAPAAIWRAEATRDRSTLGLVTNDLRASVAGSIALVDGTAAAGRPVTGSFGIVQVGDLPGVGVLVNGERIGQTDASGKLFVPTLSAYVDNDVSIAAETVPIEYSMSELSRKMSPWYRGGTLIDFQMKKLQAFTGMLRFAGADGTKPVEFAEVRFESLAGAQPFQTGRGGEFYIEDLKPGTYRAATQAQGKPCVFDLVVPASKEIFVDLGNVMCRPQP